MLISSALSTMLLKNLFFLLLSASDQIVHPIGFFPFCTEILSNHRIYPFPNLSNP